MDDRDLQLDLAAARELYPRLQDYFGVWAMQPEPMLAAAERLGSIDLAAHIRTGIQASAGSGAGRAYYAVLEGGIALIEASGSLMKFSSSLEASTSTVALRRSITAAAADREISAILLRIDSPGGTVSGTRDLADDVAAAAAIKPVYAYAEDLCCSAAYWVASQATKIFGNPTLLAPCMGTYAVVEDMSAAAAQKGVKVHVVRAGAFKGAGTPGTEITPEQLAEWQRTVDTLNDHFVEGVARGRKMSTERVRELADGRVHVGAAAVDLGLVDAIQSFEETVSQLQSRAKSMSGQATTAAAATAPVAATAQELRQACKGASDAFLFQQLEAGATVAQAQAAWSAELASQLKAEKEARAKAETENKELRAKRRAPGVRPLSDGAPKEAPKRGGDSEDEDGETDETPKQEEDEDEMQEENCEPKQELDRLVRARMKLGVPQATAIRQVCKQNPRLHRAFLLATNKPRVHAKIKDRFSA